MAPAINNNQPVEGMKAIFTLCSNNYLAQALVLCRSVHRHQPGWHMIVGLTDKKRPEIPYSTFPCEVIELGEIEPRMEELAEKYSIVELNTCIKPAVFQYIFKNRLATNVIYLDPDTCIFSPMAEVEQLLAENDFVITPHVLSPLPLDGLRPTESLFLNYGIYNLGFLAVRNSVTVMQFLDWWKERTYSIGYDRPAEGMFTDQLWINLVPVYFDRVATLRHPGYNMAPWNLHERRITHSDVGYIVNDAYPLVFFHFSGFDPAKQQFHKDYNRFQWHQRPDLWNLFEAYAGRLQGEEYERYRREPCYYAGVRAQFLQLQEITKKDKEARALAAMPFYKKVLRVVKRNIPLKLKSLAIKIAKA